MVFDFKVTRGNGDCKKTYLRHPLREKVGESLQNQTTDEYRSNLANKLMKPKDPEPPHLPKASTLRTVKGEFKATLFYNEDPTTAITIMHASIYLETIHFVSEIPVCVHHWTNHQRDVYCKYASQNKNTCIYIDATEGIFRKFDKRNKTKTHNLFLYIIAAHFAGQQFTIGQMVSEAHDTVTILNFWNNWLKYGFPQPSEVVMDSSQALLNATVSAFTSYKTVEGYSNACMKTEVPSCYIRLDVAHIMRLYSSDLKSFSPLVRIFYLACVGK